MPRYLLDTNAYFAVIEYIAAGKNDDPDIECVISGDCYISKLTEIEIISVMGKYSRGVSGGEELCTRVHSYSGLPCRQKYIVRKKSRWSSAKLRRFLALEDDIVSGRNSRIRISVLDVDSTVVREAKVFIKNALKHNFKSMDAMILGTAKANSSEDDVITIVTADKGLKAGMEKIGYPHISF